MSRKETTIVLCAGRISHRDLPIGTNLSNAMVPVNGKPVIGWILDDLMAKGLNHVVVVLREEDERLRSFLGWAYTSRLDLAVAPVRHSRTIVQSLSVGLDASGVDGLVRIVLGDTLITDPFEGEEDFVYVGKVQDSRRWCLAVTGKDGLVQDFVDKQEGVSEPKLALAGYYHLGDAETLRRCVAESISQQAAELSDTLRRYGRVHPIRARKVRNWFDFGHIDKLVEARRRLLKPRSFNRIRIHPVLNTLTKISQYNDKLQDELDWYLQIPEQLKALTPRILSYRHVNGHLEIVQEYYGYPSLAELYVYGDLHADTWMSILQKILCVHKEFCRHKGSLSVQDVESMYLDKTLSRLKAWAEQSLGWAELLQQESVTFNERVLQNVCVLESALRARAAALAASAKACVIHGDLCFSNILFDLNHQIIRLVDPRGRFGKKGVYGDPRYDIAKLRHSVCGLYDFIVADLFQLRGEGGQFEARLCVNGVPQRVAQRFDELITGAGYDPEEIRFIEGLLFLSMLPLHGDSPRRQLMMFLTGLCRLNEVL